MGGRNEESERDFGLKKKKANDKNSCPDFIKEKNVNVWEPRLKNRK